MTLSRCKYLKKERKLESLRDKLRGFKFRPLSCASSAGGASITVCSTDLTSCGIINVTIGNTVSSAISFSQTNPTLAVAQSLNVSIFGPANSLFYVASNSNPSVVQPNLSGNTLTLLGITNGSSVLSVCASSSNCGSLTVTVSQSSSGGTLMLSQQNINLSIGQTSTVTISGGVMPYNILSNGNNFVQSSLNGNILSLFGLSNGTSLLNVCSASGNCVTLSVVVGVGAATNPIVTPIVPTDCTGAAFSISTGQACPVSTVINTSQPTPLAAAGTAAPESVSELASVSTATAVFKFTKSIKLGSTGAEVLQLQKKLKTLGFYKGKVDGGFGAATVAAVKAFQKAHKLPQVGNVGPLTRAWLNK